jgi:SAM-dependent methyltransferase
MNTQPPEHGTLDAAVNARAWDNIARRDSEPDQPTPSPQRIDWTPWQGRGPGAELLGDLTDATVAELGCGTGNHLAYVAAHGAHLAIGVDVAQQRIEQARTRYDHLPNTEWRVGDAATVLPTLPLLDVCYSIFGALWYADPVLLLPAIHHRLRPGGLLAFSVNSPRVGELSGRRVDNLTLNDGARLPVIHYTYDADTWAQLLHQSGFEPDEHLPITGPEPSSYRTLIQVARRRD